MGCCGSLAEPSRDIPSASGTGKPDRPTDFQCKVGCLHTLEQQTPIEHRHCDTLWERRPSTTEDLHSPLLGRSCDEGSIKRESGLAAQIANQHSLPHNW